MLKKLDPDRSCIDDDVVTSFVDALVNSNSLCVLKLDEN